MADEIAQAAESQSAIWGYILAYADSMALKCAVELRLPDIIHAHDGPITLSQIASDIIESSTPNMDFLGRMMRYLVNMKIFTSTVDIGGGETLYGRTPLSIWITNDFKLSMSRLVLFNDHPLQQASFHNLSECIKNGGDPFTIAHGCDTWEFASENALYNKLFNEGMACTQSISMALIAKYEGLKTTESLVNVGGGTGQFLAGIVEQYPNISGVNFDLPHVIATAPELPGVTHVSGDMFKSVPEGETILLKWIMHDWPDKECIQILKNCRNAIPKDGKVVIIDVVLQPKEDGSYSEVGLKCDLLMLAHTGGKERNKLEWKTILNEGGFPRYKIIPATPPMCIIEAYPHE
jgi:hypothetical protein